MSNYIGTVCTPSSGEQNSDYFDSCFLTGKLRIAFVYMIIGQLQIVTFFQIETFCNAEPFDRSINTLNPEINH